jgi:dienelactone hydrolase
MSTVRIVSRLMVPILIFLACVAQAQPAPRVVNLPARDGIILKGTYFASAKPGPGVILFHQCNQQRKLWDPLAERLAARGVNVLTFDYRDFGESGGTPHDKLALEEEAKIEKADWPGDIEVAYQYLLSQPGVDRKVIGAGGASCGAGNAVRLARQHPEVKSLLLLAGPTDPDGRQFLRTSKQLPIFTSAAADDIFGPQVLMMQWYYSLSPNPESRFAHFKSGGHGAEMFGVQKDLPDTIAGWFEATLMNKPASAPKTNGAAMAPQLLKELAEVDQPGGDGAREVEEFLTSAGSKATAPPEFIVNLLGYEHLQAGDVKGALEILKLNTIAYPRSANVYDSLSDAYLADGQKELALQNARKALDLLVTDTADSEQRRNGIRASAEQKVKQLTPTQP